MRSNKYKDNNRKPQHFQANGVIAEEVLALPGKDGHPEISVSISI